MRGSRMVKYLLSKGDLPDEMQLDSDVAEAFHFWENLDGESESEETTSAKLVWTDKHRESVHKAMILMEAAKQCKADKQKAVVGIANAGIKRGRQPLLTNFFTPQKTCRPPIEDNPLAGTRGSRGRPHPACMTLQERHEWLKVKEMRQKLETLKGHWNVADAEQRVAEDAAEQILTTAGVAVEQLVPIVPRLLIQLPKQIKRGRGRPPLSEQEKEHRAANKVSQGKSKKVLSHCRINTLLPSIDVRQKCVAIADGMAISLHDPLGSSLTKGRWNSQVPPKQPLVIPGCSPNHAGPNGPKIPRNLFFVGF